MAKSKSTTALYLRNFVFGVEDSLVSTSGLISGVAAAGISRSEIFTTGVVLIFVEAFSMGIGSFLSEGMADDYMKQKRMSFKATMGGLIMMISYFLAGIVPLAPYAFFEVKEAFTLSILASLIALFLLGTISAKFFNISVLKHGIRMFLIGGFAILIGIAVGRLSSNG
jgi:VIT1/CCC1 family predicted Fe2+/Mn2+ transporter